MCGIFAYTGHQAKAAEIVLEGLKLLEYRGYDSWGVSVDVSGKLKVDKHVGKIGNAKVKLPTSQLGIGHTRWATHGGVTDRNAHPHLDCTHSLAVVHNGIVENFEEIKSRLLKLGHKFISETDTEVIAHLIEENFKKGNNFSEAVRKSFIMLKGMNAIVVTSSLTREIIAVKSGSPLVIGVGNKELFIASDASAIVGHTKKVVFLSDNQMAVLNKSYKIFDAATGKSIKPDVQTLSWVFEDAQKGKFKHYFLKEIYEEPQVVTNIALTKDEVTREFSGLIKKAYGTFMLGCGSASYAGIAATYIFAGIAKKHINFATGSEFKYHEDFVTRKTLLIPISQSGESIDVIEPVLRAKKDKNVKVAAVVNTIGSTLYRTADLSALLECGQEKSVVATKSFVAMIAMLFLIAFTVAGRQKEGKTLLMKSSTDIKRILQPKFIREIKKVAKVLSKKEHVYIIGRGISYSAALEASLKLKEAACIHAEAFPGGELKHGVIALVERDIPCIVFAPNDETYDEIISNAQEVKARGGYIIGIGPRDNKIFDQFLSTADTKEATLLSQVAISHLLAYFAALNRGIEDVDKPRNLAKSVTVK